MTGSIFKRKLKTGVSWGYVFSVAGTNGKRIQVFKSGFTTKDAASRAVRSVIEEYEEQHGKVSREVGTQGRRVWTYYFDGLSESGFETKAEAEVALHNAIQRRGADKLKQPENAAQAAVEAAGPLIRELGDVRLNERDAGFRTPSTI